MGQGNGEVTKRGRGGRGMENHRGTQKFCRVVVQGGEAATKGVRASRPQRQHRSPGVGNLFRPRRCVAAAGGTPELRNSSRPARISPGARLCARSTSRSRLAARGASDFHGCPRRFGAAAAGPRRTQPRSVGCGPAALCSECLCGAHSGFHCMVTVKGIGISHRGLALSGLWRAGSPRSAKKKTRPGHSSGPRCRGPMIGRVAVTSRGRGGAVQ